MNAFVHPVEVHHLQMHFQMLPNTSTWMQKLKSVTNPHMYFHNSKRGIFGCNTFCYLLEQNLTNILATQIIESRFFFQIWEIKWSYHINPLQGC